MHLLSKILNEKFLIRDPLTGACMGYDYFTNESETGGSLTLTALVVRTFTLMSVLALEDT